MHKFGIIYQDEMPGRANEFNNSVDIYVQPMELREEDLGVIYPIQCIFMWRFGFLLRQRYNAYLRTFYSEPFTSLVWVCLFIIVFISSLEFYLLSYWDSIQFGGESSFVHELLFAFSACCQQILPMRGVSVSRRIAYLTFIIGVYIVHTYYTSNLLSHLVTERETTLSLESLAKSDYAFETYKDLNLITDKKIYESAMDKNLSIVWSKLQNLQVVSLSTALTSMMNLRAAVLTDYITLYPIVKRSYEMDDICNLIEIDLYSNVKKYLFTSKNFSYKEQFKIGILRLKEAGLIRRQISLEKYLPVKCKASVNHYRSQFELTTALLILVLTAYVLAFTIMIFERIYYQRNKVWPYFN
ncbi:uncharacterized protein LOC116770911 [Danaus plexippus]|uniref:uncharacterized protein LOC116770911 n=1 Tax=Danaus plexippus TaxID=13037 RepID=UPI002AB06F35|nr:uncharacterized protein LOC116770911 [Danaus plexippus]